MATIWSDNGRAADAVITHRPRLRVFEGGAHGRGGPVGSGGHREPNEGPRLKMRYPAGFIALHPIFRPSGPAANASVLNTNLGASFRRGAGDQSLARRR
jgi:hypothetical protein